MKPVQIALPRGLTWAVAALFAAMACPGAAAGAEQLYTCGMHPQVITTEPGNCPICGMKLQPVRANSSAQAAEIRIDAGTIQRMNLQTGLVTRGPARRLIRAFGTVDFDESRLSEVTTKYEAWIEGFHVAGIGSAVKAGDPLFDVYAPEIHNAELSYLAAWRAEGAADRPLTRASAERLELFGVPPETIAELARTGEAPRIYTVRAPRSGVVVEKMAIQGQMMHPGERICRVADLSTVWVYAQLYEDDLAAIRAGQRAEIRLTYGAAGTFSGTVAQILPQVRAETRASGVRIVVANPDGALRPGMFAFVRMDVAAAADAVLVPDSAVLRSGERNTVFVALGSGAFSPRQVELGAHTADNRYVVLSGLAAGERIVVSGQFLLDSESQLREAIQKMVHPAPAGGG
jgi:membrane fusion protein, copper/silver efflux system